MRLTTVLLIASLMQVSASTLAQRITLHERNAPLKEVLKAIRSQSGYSFVYDGKTVTDDQKVTADLSNVPLIDALASVFKNLNLSYEIEGKIITIKEEEPSFLDRASSVIQSLSKDLFQSIDARGVIRDEQGNPMPNATIVVKGKSQLYRSNEKGEFNIPNVADDAVLVISYVGYQRLEINVKDAAMPLEIKLNMATGELEEVKIEYSTGYQDIPKERATGSFYQLDKGLINRSVSTNVLDRLIGVTSGLNFESRNINSTNKRKDVSIRGISTINAIQRPLIVVDGFPYEESDRQGSSVGFMDWVNNLNPNDVESVTVLKDAAAASIWGARSGNGVIVITTKKGRFNQATKVQANSNVTISEKPDLFYRPQISSSDMIDFEIAQFNKGYYDPYLNNTFTYPVVSQAVEILAKRRNNQITAEQANVQLDALRNYDLRNEINQYLRRESINQQYNAQISGGSAKYNYMASIGYDKNLANVVTDENDRLTARFDNTFKPTEKLDINIFINYTQRKSKSDPSGSVMGSPYLRLADDMGNPLATPNKFRQAYIDTARFPALLDWNYKPLEELNRNTTNQKQYDIRLGGNMRYTIINGLNAEVKYQYQKTLFNYQTYYTSESYFVRDLVNKFLYVNPANKSQILYPVPRGAIVDRGNSESGNWNIRGQFNYNRSWAKHNISALAGIEGRENITDGSGIDRIYGYDPSVGTVATILNYETIYAQRPAGSGYQRVPPSARSGTQKSINRFLSYFANGAYTYAEKYTLSGSARIDGSNFFGIKANQRILPLWSTGASWNIFKEDFYKAGWLPYLKLRMTYGFNGNMLNTATAYPTISYSSGDPNTGLPFAQVQSPGNPALRWEKVRVINYGLDFGSKNDRITGSLEYYTKKGIDLLGSILTDHTTGFKDFVGNGASISGKGMDLTLNTVNIRSAFNWTSNLLVSYNTDKVTKYEGGGLPTSNKAIYFNGIVIGKPLDALYNYRWAGLNPVNGDPQVYVADTVASFVTGSTNTDPANLVYSGSQNPQWFGSVRNAFSYKNVSLSFNILFKCNYYFSRASVNYEDLLTAYSRGSHLDYLNRWQTPGDEKITNVPSLPAASNSSRDLLYRRSDVLVEKGDHVRLQDVRLSYDLNRNVFKRLPFKNIQFYIYANNLGILWRANDLGIDPDFNNSIPNPRSVAMGLTIGF